MKKVSKALAPKQLKHLRGLGQKMKALVWVGHGQLSEPVLKEIRGCLRQRELIKVKVRLEERDDFLSACASIADETRSLLVEAKGRTCLFYRQNSKAKHQVSLPPRPPSRA